MSSNLSYLVKKSTLFKNFIYNNYLFKKLNLNISITNSLNPHIIIKMYYNILFYFYKRVLQYLKSYGRNTN
jgi:hypothetical protein